MSKNKTNKNKIVISLCGIAAIIVIAIICIAIAVNNNSSSNQDGSRMTPQELQQKSENDLINAKLDQVKAYAEIYKTENGKYPSALADFIKNPDFLAGYDVVYEQTNGGDGFILTYTANDGTKITRTND
jgi:hypothetical protein